MAVSGNKVSIDIAGRSAAEQGVTGALRAGAADVEIHGKNAVSIHAARRTAARFTTDTTELNTDVRVAGRLDMLLDGAAMWRWEVDPTGRLTGWKRADNDQWQPIISLQ